MLLKDHGERGWMKGLHLARIQTFSNRYWPSCVERYLTIIYLRFVYQSFAPTHDIMAVDISGLTCHISSPTVERQGATVISRERLGFKSNLATNLGTGDASKRCNRCITVFITSMVFAGTASMSACITAMDSLVSACTAFYFKFLSPFSSPSNPTAWTQ